MLNPPEESWDNSRVCANPVKVFCWRLRWQACFSYFSADILTLSYEEFHRQILLQEQKIIGATFGCQTPGHNHHGHNLFNLPVLKYFPLYGLECNFVIPLDQGLRKLFITQIMSVPTCSSSVVLKQTDNNLGAETCLLSMNLCDKIHKVFVNLKKKSIKESIVSETVNVSLLK